MSAGVALLAGVLSGQLATTPVVPLSPPADSTARVYRVVDGRTGAPLAGALLSCVAERETPGRGTFFSDHHAHSDDLGFVRLDRAPGSWLVVEAEGYATTSWSDPPTDDILRVQPGVTIPVQILDALGNPAPGVEVGYCLGCGHTPDVQVARTGTDGIAWLRDVDPTDTFEHAEIRDLYPMGSGLDGDPGGLSWLPGDGPYRLRCAGAPDLVGTVVDASDRPADRVVVRQYERHRGPVTHTDPQGRFRVVSPFAGSRAVVVLQWGLPATDMMLPPTTPITLRLPRLPTDTVEIDRRPVRVKVVRAGHGIELPGVKVRAVPLVADVNSDDGGETNEEGMVELDLPPGGCVLWASDPMHEHQQIERPFTVGAEGTTEVTVALRPARRIRVHAEGLALSDADMILLATPRGDLERPHWQHQDDPLPVPDGPCALVIRHRGHLRSFGIDAEQDRLTVRWPAPHAVTGRLLDGDGTPVEGAIAITGNVVTELEWTRVGADGNFRLTTDEDGGALVHVRPKRGLPRVVHVTLPPFGESAVVRLGDLSAATPDAARLRVLDAAGNPVAHRETRLIRPGISRLAQLDADGIWSDLDPAAGDFIVIEPLGGSSERPGSARHREQLRGPGPWTIRLPSGRAECTVVDAHGHRLDEVDVYLGDQHWQCPGRFDLNGLPAGRHVLVLSHEKAGAGFVELPWGEGEQRSVRIQLSGSQ